MNRREALKTASVTSGLALLSSTGLAGDNKKKQADKFKFSLNTSTISGQKLGVEKYIDIAARAGYDCMELWIPDLRAYLDNGGTLPKLKKLIDDSKVPVVNAIGFAPWMIDDEEKRNAGFKQMREEMEMMAALGCPRIAAPSAGIGRDAQLDMFVVGERFAKLIELGKETGVIPQLEFWGASRFHHIGQALMAAAHTLKGSLLVLSADRASTAALELEKLGRQSKLQGAADWFAILESEVHAVSSELHKIVKERLTTAVRH